MSKLSRAAHIFTAPFTGNVIRPIARKVIERTITSRARAIQEVISNNRELFPTVLQPSTDSERIFQAVMQELWDAVEAIVDVVQRQDGKFDLVELIEVCILELADDEVYDQLALEQVSELASPFDKMVLNIIDNKQRFLALCRFIQREGIKDIDELLKRAPEVAASISAETEKILDQMLSEDESPVVRRVLVIALELNSVTRRRG